MEKGGILEFLLIIGGAVLVAVIVIALLVGLSNGQQENKASADLEDAKFWYDAGFEAGSVSDACRFGDVSGFALEQGYDVNVIFRKNRINVYLISEDLTGFQESYCEQKQELEK